MGLRAVILGGLPEQVHPLEVGICSLSEDFFQVRQRGQASRSESGRIHDVADVSPSRVDESPRKRGRPAQAGGYFRSSLLYGLNQSILGGVLLHAGTGGGCSDAPNPLAPVIANRSGDPKLFLES